MSENSYWFSIKHAYISVSLFITCQNVLALENNTNYLCKLRILAYLQYNCNFRLKWTGISKFPTGFSEVLLNSTNLAIFKLLMLKILSIDIVFQRYARFNKSNNIQQ